MEGLINQGKSLAEIGSEVIEVEFRSHTNKENYLKLLKHVENMQNYTVTFTRQCDIIDKIDHRIVRTKWGSSGGSARECLIKINKGNIYNYEDGKIAISSEKPLEDCPKIDNENGLCYIKLRASFKTTHWSIDFTARNEIKDMRSITPNVKRHFKNNLETMDDYLRHCEVIYSDYMIEIDHEISKKNSSVPTEEIVQEFNSIMKAIFLEDRDVEFRQYFHEAIKLIYSGHKLYGAKTIKDVTPSVLVFTKNDIINKFPMNNWYVSDKPDGYRCLIYMNKKGKILALPDGVVELAGDATGPVQTCLFEGEIIVEKSPPEVAQISELNTPEHLKKVVGFAEGKKPISIIIFDIIYMDEEPVYTYNFEDRLEKIPEAVTILNEAISSRGTALGKSLKIEAKPFFKLNAPRNAADPNLLDLQEYRNNIDIAYNMHKDKEYDIDGLIFVEPGASYAETNWYKWKESSHNTIDFLSMQVPDSFYKTKPNMQKKDYRLYILFVGASVNQLKALNMQQLSYHNVIFPLRTVQGQQRPIHFVSPLMESLYYYYSKQDINGKIIELSPVWTNVGNDTRFGWKFIRIREDRQADLDSGNYYGNNITAAGLNFSMFINPISISDLKGEFSDGYFVRDRSNIYRSVTAHNSAVKAYLFEKYIKGVNILVDYGCGRADFEKYRHVKKRVYAVDKDNNALTELLSRYYRSVIGTKANFSGSELMITQSDLNQNYEKTLDLLRMRNIPQMRKPASDPTKTNKTIIVADACSTNMSVHYFVHTEKLMTNYVSLVENTLKAGAPLIITMMDGKKLYKFLAEREGEWMSFGDTIRKYHMKIEPSGPNWPAPGGSVKIDLLLPFSNHKMMTEQLIDVEYFIKKITTRDFELVEDFNFADKIGQIGHNIGELSEDDKIFIGFYRALVFRRIVPTNKK